MSKCPVENGEFGDWQTYCLKCAACSIEESCRIEHDRKTNEAIKKVFNIRYIKIPGGFYLDENLNAQDREILALVLLRSQKWGHSYDKNRSLAELLGMGESRIGKIVRNLAFRGYLKLEIQKLKRRSTNAKPGYRTSRMLALTRKSLRLVNLCQFTKDKIEKEQI